VERLELSVHNLTHPTLGRVVVFQEMRVNQQCSTFHCVAVPAIVQAVNEDETVNLWVFGFSEVSLFQSAKQGSGPCEWDWSDVSSSSI